jgi:hypothetical protein
VLERLLLPGVVAALPKAQSQHGFAALHSCATVLLPIATKVAIGFNNPKPAHRSALCAIDISKAFDTVNHTLLLEQISASALHPNLVRWIAAYLRGRSARCIWNIAKSSPRIIYSGVPQGTVLSPVLFNYFVLDCLTLAQEFYADNFNIFESDSDLTLLSQKPQANVDAAQEWAIRKRLTIAPAKSQVTLFTPRYKQFGVHP